LRRPIYFSPCPTDGRREPAGESGDEASRVDVDRRATAVFAADFQPKPFPGLGKRLFLSKYRNREKILFEGAIIGGTSDPVAPDEPVLRWLNLQPLTSKDGA
jgi:hypothetical protein